MKSMELQIIELQQRALEKLGDLLGGDVAFLVSGLREEINTVIQKHTYRELTGKGSTGKTNRLTQYPSEQQVEHATVVSLMCEFVSGDTTGYEEGGQWCFDKVNTTPLPENPKEIRSGFYRLENIRYLILKLTHLSDAHLLFIRLPRVLDEVPKYTVTSLLNWGEQVITHEHLEVFDKTQLRKEFIGTLKREGFQIPVYIPKTTFIKALIAAKQIGVEFTVHPYTVIFDGEDLHVHDGQKDLDWDSLNATKKNQFYTCVSVE